MRSKIFHIVSVLILISMLLTSCGSPATQEAPAAQAPATGATEAPAAPAAVEEQVTLTIIIEQVPDYDIVAELAKEFEAENPNIKIAWDAMP